MHVQREVITQSRESNDLTYSSARRRLGAGVEPRLCCRTLALVDLTRPQASINVRIVSRQADQTKTPGLADALKSLVTIPNNNTAEHAAERGFGTVRGEAIGSGKGRVEVILSG